MAVIDTSVISETSRPRPNPHVDAWLRDSADMALALSVAVVFEIQRGIEMVRPQHPEKADALTSWLLGLLASRMRQLPVCVPTARLWAVMVARPELKQLWISDPHARKPKLSLDLLIAATAIVHEMPIVTMNGDDFRFIDQYFPLPGLIQPSEPAPSPISGLRQSMVANDHVDNAPTWSHTTKQTGAPPRCHSVSFGSDLTP